MKTNFKKDQTEINKENDSQEIKNDLTAKEFEEYVINSGARGSFMIYRSDKKEEELGLDEL